MPLKQTKTGGNIRIQYLADKLLAVVGFDLVSPESVAIICLKITTVTDVGHGSGVPDHVVLQILLPSSPDEQEHYTITKYKSIVDSRGVFIRMYLNYSKTIINI